MRSNQLGYASVGMTGFEPATSWSQTRRATNCATSRWNTGDPALPRYYSKRRRACQDLFPKKTKKRSTFFAERFLFLREKIGKGS